MPLTYLSACYVVGCWAVFMQWWHQAFLFLGRSDITDYANYVVVHIVDPESLPHYRRGRIPDLVCYLSPDFAPRVLHFSHYLLLPPAIRMRPTVRMRPSLHLLSFCDLPCEFSLVATCPTPSVLLRPALRIFSCCDLPYAFSLVATCPTHSLLLRPALRFSLDATCHTFLSCCDLPYVSLLLLPALRFSLVATCPTFLPCWDLPYVSLLLRPATTDAPHISSFQKHCSYIREYCLFAASTHSIVRVLQFQGALPVGSINSLYCTGAPISGNIACLEHQLTLLHGCSNFREHCLLGTSNHSIARVLQFQGELPVGSINYCTGAPILGSIGCWEHQLTLFHGCSHFREHCMLGASTHSIARVLPSHPELRYMKNKYIVYYIFSLHFFRVAIEIKIASDTT